MSYPALNAYLARLSDPARAATSVWLDRQGRAHGRYFNCTMTSAFAPIRRIGDGAVVAYEGLARSVAVQDDGLSLWRLLDNAASDDESIELDRLCRMLHAVNFFRQPAAASGDLYLSVHDRLLGAVSSNHGHAFRRILIALGLPVERVVLQLPLATGAQTWLLGYVADNYRHNGFRLALHAASPAQALGLIERVHPSVIKLDARALGDRDDIGALLLAAQAQRASIVFRRVDEAGVAARLTAASAAAGVALHVQGRLFDTPHAELVAPVAARGPSLGAHASASPIAHA